MSIDTPDSAHSATSNSLRGTSLSASLTVNDLAKSVAWYSDVVGFTVEQRHERDGVLQAVSLSAGVAKIVLGRDDGARGVNRVKGEGFSLMITTTDDIDELAA
ncbi:MAG: VOC family protein, partial [Gemmatimonadaceae bacterium]|nr:VOC family protein [Gemmatimonadaceae bacterium]